MAGSLRQLVPDDHILVRVPGVLDLSWLREAVADCYVARTGRPGIDPEAAMRLMLSGPLLGIAHDRRLLREAQVKLAIRWFAGYGLMEALPDHSSLTRIRQGWGAERSGQLLARTVQCCMAAGLATGELVHLDCTLIRADVDRDALERTRAAVVAAKDGRPAKRGRVIATRCKTDPDATLATNNTARRSEPAYKQHPAVDAACGVVLDVSVTTGAVHDTQKVAEQLADIAATTGTAIAVATMDAGCATTTVFATLEQRGIEAIVPTKAGRPRSPTPSRCGGSSRCGRTASPNARGFQHYRAARARFAGAPAMRRTMDQHIGCGGDG